MRVEHRYGIPGNPPRELPLDVDLPMPAAVRERRPVLVDTRAEWLERFPARPPGGGFESFAAVPLLFEGQVPGCMGLGFPDPGPFADADVALLVAIARLGAQALDRARLYEERAYVARTLQAGLLPRELPAIPGLDVAVRYRPVGDGSEVGGDFYDLFGVEQDAWLVAVGDVCGKGTQAAVLSGVVRSTIRALAGRDSAPAAILDGVNDALLRESAPNALSTAACASVEVAPGGEGAAVRISAGGHPPALVRRADGTVEAVDVGGPMLGVVPGARLAEVTLALAPGDLLLLYTDGVLDARVGKGIFGEQRLRDALAAADGQDAGQTVASIDAALRTSSPGPPRDDKALLALRVLPAA
jgi:serine phosphatase RsbU (regulator of sigma subunit)